MKSTFLRDTIIFLCVAGLVIYIGVNTISKMDERYEQCNKQYGKDKWKFLEITGTRRADRIAGKNYIGQVWTCVSNSTHSETQMLVRL